MDEKILSKKDRTKPLQTLILPKSFKLAFNAKTSTRVVHRCARTNISAIPDIFGEMNEIFIKHTR